MWHDSLLLVVCSEFLSLALCAAGILLLDEPAQKSPAIMLIAAGALRGGPGGDQLDGWPESMRVFARRERPHPGAQLSLFETLDGWHYSLWVSNVPAGLRGWRAQLGYIDAAHRVHARVEDCIRTGKDSGIGRFPRTTSR